MEMIKEATLIKLERTMYRVGQYLIRKDNEKL